MIEGNPPAIFFVVDSIQEFVMQIRLSDVSINYEDTGAEKSSTLPIILLIHGYPLSLKMWQLQLGELNSSARLIALDLRGFGDSGFTPGPYSMELLADDCINLLDKLNITRPVIVCGLSMGGYIALSLYRKYPHRVQGLILTATRATADSAEAKTNRDKAIMLAEKEGVEAITRLMLSKMLSVRTYNTRPELVDRVRSILLSASIPGITGVLAGMRDRSDSTPILPQVKVPTLLVFGEEDQFVPKAEIEDMHNLIKGSQLHWIPDAGHLPNLEQPAIFNSLIQGYLTGITD
jgi:3-oxoadipate enol-lactonase